MEGRSPEEQAVADAPLGTGDRSGYLETLDDFSRCCELDANLNACMTNL
jgi:hypothetical protein